MDKYYYQFDSGPKPSGIKVQPAKPAGYISFGNGAAVDWTQFDYVNGELVAVPVPEPPAPSVPSLSDTKQSKLYQISSWTHSAIVGGFSSAASGTEHTFDSTEEDQGNLALMQTVSHSSRFATHPIYQGRIPIRAIPAGQTGKTVLYLTTAQMDLLIEDLALHIGTCKQRGWELQGDVGAATTVEAVSAIAW